MQTGDTVECIDDTSKQLPYKVIIPVKGKFYTIRDVRDTNYGPGFLLEEIVNEPVHFQEGLLEPVYDPKRFRKLDVQINEITEVLESKITS